MYMFICTLYNSSVRPSKRSFKCTSSIFSTMEILCHMIINHLNESALYLMPKKPFMIDWYYRLRDKTLSQICRGPNIYQIINWLTAIKLFVNVALTFTKLQGVREILPDQKDEIFFWNEGILTFSGFFQAKGFIFWMIVELLDYLFSFYSYH